MNDDQLIDRLEESLPSFDDQQLETIYHLCWVELLDRGIRHLTDEELEDGNDPSE